MRYFVLFLILALTPSLADAGKGGSSYSGGGRPSFSSGSSRPSTSSFSSSSKPSTSSTPRPSFSSGSSSSSGSSTSLFSSKPKTVSFDSLGSTEAKKAESRAAYTKSSTPASSFKVGGKEVKIDPKAKETEFVRSKVTDQSWQNRSTRTASTYAPYQSQPVVVYHDNYNPMWNYWLMSQSLDTMSLWVYHHQATMDAERLKNLYASNADLKAKVEALEKQGVAKDETWSPSGVDPDLQYSDEYVDAVYNPGVKPEHSYNPGVNPEHSALGNFCMGFCIVVIFLVVILVGTHFIWG